MSRRVVGPILVLLWAGGLGLGVALLDGRQEQFSVEVWLAVGGTLVVADLAWRLIRSAGDRSTVVAGGYGGRRLGLRRTVRQLRHWLSEEESTRGGRRGSDTYGDINGRALPVQVQSLANLLDLSYENEAHFKRRLRPRLQALAEHYLPLRHDIDPSDKLEVKRLLGESSWLVDGALGSHTSSSAVPTADEVARCLRLILDEPPHGLPPDDLPLD